MRRYVLSSAIAVCILCVLQIQAQDDLPQPGQPAPAEQASPGAARPGATAAPAPAAADEATYRQQTSYALGRNFAANLKGNEIECDLDYLVAGISDVLRNAPPKWSDAELETALERFGGEMQQKAQARMQRQAVVNEQAAAKFLAENAKREGVQTTPSGLQYRVIRQGNGPSPTLSDMVRCNYRGVLLDGTEFDNTVRHGRPAEFRVAGVIPGWTEALQKMKVGDKWQIFVPPKLGYELNPPPDAPIEPNSLLIFEIELLDIVKE